MEMRRKLVARSLFLTALLSTCLSHAAVELKEGLANPNDIQVVPVEKTPEPGQVRLRIQYPHENEIKTDQPVGMGTRLDWFPLGVESGNFRRRYEIRNPGRGQTLHIFIDNFSYFTINEALFDALDDHDEFFDQISEFYIPYKLSPGMHIIRAFPCRSYGESLKEPQRSATSTFYYQSKEPAIDMDLTGPYLTYNEPQGIYPDASQPILLDFYINNCALSKDGFKVRITIDGANERFLYDWVPYYIYGLKSGNHTVRLELLNPQNQLVPGTFNDVTRTIRLD